MVALPFPRSSTPGHLPGEGEGRLINACVELLGDGFLWRRAPGFSSYVAVPASGPARGIVSVNGTLFVAHPTVVNFVGPDLSFGGVVAIPGSDGVTFAANNRVFQGMSTPDLVAVRESGGAYLIDAFARSGGAYPGGNLPGTVNSVGFLEGYFLFTIPDGRIFASELNSTTVNALSFATAESASDRLVRGITTADTFYAMGSSTIEPWKNVGTSPFPFARVPSVIPVGLLTAMAVAGFDEGWDHAPHFVAHDGTVRALNGYDTAIVSTPDVERFIAASTISSLEACVFTSRGHAFWCLSSDVGTWVYDVTGKAWHERVSAGLNRWRASRSVKAGGKWVLGDTISASLFVVSDTAITEAGAPLMWTVESAALKEYPVRASVSALFGDFALAAADVASAPQVAISWSRDGGASWSAPVSRPLAAVPVRVNRLGLTTDQGLRVRFSVAASVTFSFSGAAVPKPDLRTP